MEMGLGIHGEPGAETLPLQLVDATVGQVQGLSLTLRRQILLCSALHAGICCASSKSRCNTCSNNLQQQPSSDNAAQSCRCL